jgi:hypothetical protein
MYTHHNWTQVGPLTTGCFGYIENKARLWYLDWGMCMFLVCICRFMHEDVLLILEAKQDSDILTEVCACFWYTCVGLCMRMVCLYWKQSKDSDTLSQVITCSGLYTCICVVQIFVLLILFVDMENKARFWYLVSDNYMCLYTCMCV